MKTPGEALLEFQIATAGENQVELKMLSRFLPRGLWGLIYWYGLYPFHQWIFYGMLKSIAATIGKPILSGPEKHNWVNDSCALPSPK
jgi:hypothetical protein